ncbi:hypothetical protein [Halorarius halobius]|uniref:hypothetical protein n=1 Tax=Halorarius halobius TaxID=2962671 RepID=UPI0020CD89F6|nr:hypothetical protein [Halorarius halobius]
MRLALDIETVSPDLGPDERPDFRDSDDFELLAVALGYERPEGVESTVLFRDGTDAASELALLDRVLDWCDARPAKTLVTYNGEAFDLLHLRGRAERAAAAVGDDEVPDRVDAFLDGLAHDDLRDRAVDRWGGRPRFEDACDRVGVDVPETLWREYDHGRDPRAWRGATGTDDPTVQNSDVPGFGAAYLDLAAVGATDTLTFRELERMLTDYALADVEPLFELADAL